MKKTAANDKKKRDSTAYSKFTHEQTLFLVYFKGVKRLGRLSVATRYRKQFPEDQRDEKSLFNRMHKEGVKDAAEVLQEYAGQLARGNYTWIQEEDIEMLGKSIPYFELILDPYPPITAQVITAGQRQKVVRSTTRRAKRKRPS